MTVLDRMLDDVRKTKVCYIEDIAKLFKLYADTTISIKNFDSLYDMTLEELDTTFNNYKDLFEREEADRHHLRFHR